MSRISARRLSAASTTAALKILPPRRRGGTAGVDARKAKGSEEKVSRILFPALAPRAMVIPLARRSHGGSSELPGSIRAGHPLASPLFALAPRGVYRAAPVTGGAVRSYRTFSPLPAPPPRGAALGRCVFCGTFLRLAPTGSCPARCPAEFGLSSPGMNPAATISSPPTALNLAAESPEGQTSQVDRPTSLRSADPQGRDRDRGGGPPAGLCYSGASPPSGRRGDVTNLPCHGRTFA